MASKKTTPPEFIRRHKDMGPLQDLLLAACPPDPVSGIKSIPILAEALGMSPWGVFKWIHASRIPPRQATRVVDLSESRVTLGDFSAFIYF